MVNTKYEVRISEQNPINIVQYTAFSFYMEARDVYLLINGYKR